MTDEEVIKLLKTFAKALIHHLQAMNRWLLDRCKIKDGDIAEQKAEIERHTSLYDGKSGFMTSSIGDLPLTVEGLSKALDEIARLYRVQVELLQEYNKKNYNDAKDLRRKNAELQKQVDELKGMVCDYVADKCKLFVKAQQTDIENTEQKAKIEQLNAVLLEAKTNIVAYGTACVKSGYEKATKDTVKEILAMFDDRNYITEDDLKKAIAERYGVEVE